MKNIHRIFTAIILLTLMFTAAQAQKLSGEWKLVEARENGKQISLGRKIKTSLKFGEENRISGSAGCNRYSTTYKLERRSRIKFEPIISTKMACLDNDFMKQENTFFSVMQRAGKYQINGKYLIFSDASEKNVLRFARLSR